MLQGMLKISGQLDTRQFWPVGRSDADTTEILVQTTSDSFQFSETGRSEFKKTRAFIGSHVTGEKGRFDTLKNGELTVRLQGIDAPELHYRPPALLPPPTSQSKNKRSQKQHELYLQWNNEYRQHYAESAARALSDLLSSSQDKLPCTVWSTADSPSDVFDVYGRLVGDIKVKIKKREIHLNLWLVKNGHAFPAIYTGMNTDEINAILTAGMAAKRKKLGIWRHYTGKQPAFRFSLQYRKPSPQSTTVSSDAGTLSWPKVFRRQAEHAVNRRAQMLKMGFEAFLAKKKDYVHLLEEYLLQSGDAAPVHELQDFLTNGKLTVEPWQLVFRSKPSKVVRNRKDAAW